MQVHAGTPCRAAALELILVEEMGVEDEYQKNVINVACRQVILRP